IDYSREVEAVAKFSHGKACLFWYYVHCFVECYGWHESQDMFFIVMEYLQHGGLQKYLNQLFPEPQVKNIASQLVEGLGYMHDNGVTHRDLKPANILVCQPGRDWWIKIADFGITKRAEQDSTALRTLIGTEGYLAPDVIGFIVDQSSQSSNYTSVIDIWALGELLFRMLSNRAAFLTRQDLFGYVVHGNAFPVSVLTELGASQDCCEFVANSMIANPKNRFTAKGASAHSWV
ncbi:kinase-like domain-containing protein, partial [Dactylonectria estremocensis]